MAQARTRRVVLLGALLVLVLAAAQRIDRLGDLFAHREVATVARAQEAKTAADQPPPAAQGPSQEDGTQQEHSGQAAEPSAPARGMTRSEHDLFADLQERRRRLEEREAKLKLKEQVLAATEQRIQKEIARLNGIKEEIAKLVASFNAAEDRKLGELVKVYESMKPKDAAPIFQRLDLDIQERLARQMKPAKTAALLANMDPEAAKTLTTRLATAKKLPDVEQLVAQDAR